MGDRTDSQVNVVHLELLQAGVNRIRDVGNVRDHFRRNEKLRPVNLALLDRCAKFRFCVVHFRAVKMCVSELDGRL